MKLTPVVRAGNLCPLIPSAKSGVFKNTLDLTPTDRFILLVLIRR